MCGIVGYIGKRDALPVLLDGLRRLEYRGYDSSGIAICDREVLNLKAVGKVSQLNKKIKDKKPKAKMGIAHTRWATHGKATEVNAHPHCDCSKSIWLVHNGIIENYQDLKNDLISAGHKFKSETDTEVIAHLIEDFYEGDLKTALRKTLKKIKGTYALVVFHKDHPNKLLVARHASPLLLGIGVDEIVLASDASAIIQFTNEIIYLEDGEIVEINNTDYEISDLNSKIIKRKPTAIMYDSADAELNGFNHFMEKEIDEQPQAILSSLEGRAIFDKNEVVFEELKNFKEQIKEIKKIVISACGTAYNAGLVSGYLIEEYLGIPTRVEFASEFRYRNPVIEDKTLFLALSQSGETADTLAAVREAKRKGALTIGVVNVVDSTIAREVDAVIYNRIGPEISVASTKAFSSQYAIMLMLMKYLADIKNIKSKKIDSILKELQKIPELINEILNLESRIKEISEKYYESKQIAFLGRKYNYPIAMEGTLKLKELSYIHAEAFASGEMKHGAIALIDKNFPSIFISPQDSVYEKNLNNMEEIKARGGPIIAVATQGDDKIQKISDDIIYIPKTIEALTPILTTIPLQFFAYHMAVLNGRDVDKPRNLAKSVTVE